MKNIFLGAWRRLNRYVLLLQTIGNAAILLLAMAWLHIPDSHAWQVACSLLSATVLVSAFLYLHTDTLRRIRKGAKCTSVWVGMLLLAAWIVMPRMLVEPNNRFIALV